MKVNSTVNTARLGKWSAWKFNSGRIYVNQTDQPVVPDTTRMTKEMVRQQGKDALSWTDLLPPVADMLFCVPNPSETNAH